MVACGESMCGACRHKVEVFNDLALEAASRLRKGQKIAVHGRLRVRHAQGSQVAAQTRSPLSHDTPSKGYACEYGHRHAGLTRGAAASFDLLSHSGNLLRAPCVSAEPAWQIDQWTVRDSGLPKQRAKVVADQIATVRPYQVSLLSTASCNVPVRQHSQLCATCAVAVVCWGVNSLTPTSSLRPVTSPQTSSPSCSRTLALTRLIIRPLPCLKPMHATFPNCPRPA